jgi:hypothetical protein
MVAMTAPALRPEPITETAGAPIHFGPDTFFSCMTDWPRFLSVGSAWPAGSVTTLVIASIALCGHTQVFCGLPVGSRAP